MAFNGSLLLVIILSDSGLVMLICGCSKILKWNVRCSRTLENGKTNATQNYVFESFVTEAFRIASSLYSARSLYFPQVMFHV